MKDLILAIRLRFTPTHFEYFKGLNGLDKKYKLFRGEIYKKIIQWRKENPFVPVDDSEARKMYENRSFIKLEIGKVYEVQKSDMAFKNKNVCKVYNADWDLGTVLRYMGVDGDGDHVLNGVAGDDYYSDEDLQVLGIPSEDKIDEFESRMIVLEDLRARKQKAKEEYDKLRKYEQDVINR